MIDKILANITLILIGFLITYHLINGNYAAASSSALAMFFCMVRMEEKGLFLYFGDNNDC